MPNGIYRSDLLLWTTEGGGYYNNSNPAVGGLGNPPAASKFNANGQSEIMDLSSVKELLIFVNLVSFTGGTTPTFQPEWDIVDDHVAGGVWSPTTDVIPLWKPTAVSAATKFLTWFGTSQGAAPTIAGFTTLVVPVGFGNLGRFAWTITGAPTSVAWSAFIYGK